jgi:hypothetical protein
MNGNQHLSELRQIYSVPNFFFYKNFHIYSTLTLIIVVEVCN